MIRVDAAFFQAFPYGLSIFICMLHDTMVIPAGQMACSGVASYETGPFLVAVRDHFDRVLCLDPCLGHGLYGLNAADDAKSSVEHAAAVYGIDVGTCHNYGSVRICALFSSYQVSGCVHMHGHAGFFHVLFNLCVRFVLFR